MTMIRKAPPRDVVTQFIKLIEEHPELAELLVQEPKGQILVEENEWGRTIIKDITLMRIKIVEKRDKSDIMWADSVPLGPRTYIALTIYKDDPATLWIHPVRKGAKLSLGLDKYKARRLARILLYASEILVPLRGEDEPTPKQPKN